MTTQTTLETIIAKYGKDVVDYAHLHNISYTRAVEAIESYRLWKLEQEALDNLDPCAEGW